MAAWQMPVRRGPVNLSCMEADLMAVFGPWLPLLFGVGTVLLVGGLLTKEMSPNSTAKGLGRSAAAAGWKMMLLAAAIYFLVRVLAAVFENMVSNLPGA